MEYFIWFALFVFGCMAGFGLCVYLKEEKDND